MPTQIDEISRVYARSLFDLAEKAGGEASVGSVGDELEAVAEIARGDAKFREFLASPIVDSKDRSAAVKRIFEGRVSQLLLRFLLVVGHKGRLGHLLGIADAFDQLVQERFGRIEVDVFTVNGGRLEPNVENTVKQRIKEAFNKEAVLHSYADAQMIGGIKLRVGDQLIDGSVATRLRRLRQSLADRGASDLSQNAPKFLS